MDYKYNLMCDQYAYHSRVLCSATDQVCSVCGIPQGSAHRSIPLTCALVISGACYRGADCSS